MRHLIPSWVRVPFVFFIIFGLVEYVGKAGKRPALAWRAMRLLFLGFVLFLLIASDAISSSLENMLYQSLDEAAKARYDGKKPHSSKLMATINTVYQKSLGSK